MRTVFVFALVLLASAVSGRKLAQSNPSLGNVAGRVAGAVVGGVVDTITGSGSSSNNNQNRGNNQGNINNNNNNNNNNFNQGNNQQWSNNNQGNNQQWSNSNQGNTQGNNQGSVYRTYTRPVQEPNSDALLAWRDYTSKCTGSRFNPSNTASSTCATLSGRLCSRSDVRCGQERGTTLFLDSFGNTIARGNDDSGNLSS